MKLTASAKHVSAVVVAILLSTVGIWYSYLIVTDTIRPVFSTWLLFAIATATSLFTYMRSDAGTKDLVTNIGNSIDCGVNWLIFLTLIFFGRPNYAFSGFEMLCLGLSALIILYYFISKRATFANIAINIVMTIGYLPTIVGLYLSKSNSESLLFWVIGLVALVFASYSPIKEKDWLAFLYVARAFVLISIIVTLIMINGGGS